jgi:hypothetical protein
MVLRGQESLTYRSQLGPPHHSRPPFPRVSPPTTVVLTCPMLFLSCSTVPLPKTSPTPHSCLADLLFYHHLFREAFPGSPWAPFLGSIKALPSPITVLVVDL